MYRFAIEYWPEAYTQFELMQAGKTTTEWDEWVFWLEQHRVAMMEESNQYFFSWGYAWLSYYQMLVRSVAFTVGPCVMCFYTYKTCTWMHK